MVQLAGHHVRRMTLLRLQAANRALFSRLPSTDIFGGNFTLPEGILEYTQRNYEWLVKQVAENVDVPYVAISVEFLLIFFSLPPATGFTPGSSFSNSTVLRRATLL